MKRKSAVKAIAILFIALGIWYLGSFLLPFFVTDSDQNMNLSYLIYTAFLFHAGFDLYRLKESGRNLAIVLFSIRIITNLVLTIWLLSQNGEPFQVFLKFLGKPFLVTDNRFTFVMIMLSWCLIVLLMMAFLLQKKTKELFSTDAKETSLESKVLL